MLDLALKDIIGHKARTFLTVLGVVIAIAAIVSLGSISAGMNELVSGQMRMMSGTIRLTESGVSSDAGPPTGNLKLDDLEEIRNIDGVEEVAPMTIKQSGGFFIAGVDFERMELMDLANVKTTEGDWPDEGEFKVVLGDYVAETRGIGLGDTIKVEDSELEVSGVLEPLSTFMDFAVITSLETIQDVYDDPDHATQAFVKPNDLSDVDAIVEEIESEFPTISATSMADALEDAEASINNIRFITLGIGFIASLVAAIGIINTMFMSVSERKRQIGIMKAVGASRRQIIIDVLQQAVIISFMGGFIGVLFGFLGTAGLNYSIGMPIARVTWDLALLSFSYGVILTLLSSIYPAIQASRTDPIDAIRGAA